MRAFILNHKDSLAKVSVFLVFLVFLYFFVKYIFAFVLPFIVAWILSLILYPLTSLLIKKCRIPNAIASILTVIIAIVALVLIGNSLVLKLISEAKSFSETIPAIVDQTVVVINNLYVSITEMVELLPNQLRDSLDSILLSLRGTMTSFLGSSVQRGSVNFVSNLPNAFVFSIVTFVSTFLIIKDRKIINAFVKTQMPNKWLNTIDILKKGLVGALGGYIKAQLIIMCFIGIIVIIGLSILQYKYVLLMALIICVIDALPIFGGGLILWPWMAFSLATGNIKYFVGLAIIYVSVLVTRQMLEPKFIGKNIGVHPLATLMSMYVGLKIFGVMGFLIGPTIIVSLNAFQEANLLPQWKKVNFGESKQKQKNKK